MRKKSEKMKIIDKIHSVMREIRLYQEPKCVTCNGTKGDKVLQLGHIITKGCNSTRFDWDNLHTQCRTCNNIHEYRPEIYIDWYIRTYGLESWQDLVRRSKKIKQWKMVELRELLEAMRKLKKEIIK